MPPFDFRKATAKLFMELQQYETASDVIDTLLQEDDDVFDVWYISGLTSYHLQDYEAALSEFLQAIKIFEKYQLSDDPNQCEVRQHIEQLKEEIQSKHLADQDQTNTQKNDDERMEL